MSGTFHNADATVSARQAVSVTPADGTLIRCTRALYVGTAGNLAVRMAGSDATITFTNVQIGVFPVQVTEVLATGTTASGIIALY